MATMSFFKEAVITDADIAKKVVDDLEAFDGKTTRNADENLTVSRTYTELLGENIKTF